MTAQEQRIYAGLMTELEQCADEPRQRATVLAEIQTYLTCLLLHQQPTQKKPAPNAPQIHITLSPPAISPL